MLKVRPLCAGLLACAVAAWSTRASADESATALALFQEGRALMQENNHALACAKFAESQRLAPAPGTLLNLGECQRKLGKTATAWATYIEAITAAKALGQSDRESYARMRAAELEPSLPRLTIRVTVIPEIPGLIVRRDGVALGTGAWNTSLPVDPGEHVIEASAPDRRPWRTTSKLREGERSEIAVPGLEREREEVRPAEPVSRPFFTQRRIGLVVAGLGVASLGVGGFFGFSAIGTNDEANSHCRTSDFCDAAGLALKDDARGEAMLSTVFTITGAAALIGGVVLFLTGGDGADRGPSSRTATVR